jgi:WD40 repeat protein
LYVLISFSSLFCYLISVVVAEENERLKDLLRSHGIDPFSGIAENNQKKKSRDEVFIIEDGDGKYPSQPNLRIENASGKMNSLSVSYGSLDGSDTDVIICGGVDKTLRVFDLHGEPLRQIEFSAPILAIDTYGPLVSCSLMDGGHTLVNLSTPSSDPEIYRTHNKYVVGTGWSSNGKYLYTCSHDKSVALFKLNRLVISPFTLLH